MIKKISTLAISMFVAISTIWASGFQVVEQGASNIGTALAGAVVNANNDATAAYWNPSAAFFVEGDNKIDGAGTFIIPTMKFKGSATWPGGTIPNNDGGNAGQLAFVPNFFYVHKFNDAVLATLSVTSPYGLTTKYNSGFEGGAEGVKSELMDIQINPSVAVKPLDWLSLCVGASADYVTADLTSSNYLGGPSQFVEAKGHSWSGSFNVGATVTFLETGRFGVSYRYQISQSLDGNLTKRGPLANGSPDITADLDLPSVLTAGVYYRFKEDGWKQFAVMADYSWTQWSSFQELAIKETGSGQVHTTEEKWRDTSRISVGMHYYPEWDENLVFRLGACYDQSPVRSASLRTVRIPDADRWWISGGIGYKFGNMNIDLAYTYILFDNSSINSSAGNGYNVTGSYTGEAHIVSVQAGLKW